MTKETAPGPYTTPEGYYDQPFTWVYNTVNFTAGQNLLNQQIAMNILVGDFVLRRVAGFLNILDPTSGQFQLRDEHGGYLEHEPINVSQADELAILPEIKYPWNGAIMFDLYGLL